MFTSDVNNLPKKIYSVGFLDLSFNLSKNPLTDDVILFTSIPAIKNSVKNLVLTKLGEVLFNPYFGFNANNYLFTIANNTNSADLIDKISEIIATYEPRVQLTQIDVINSFTNLDLTVTINFLIIGQPPDIQTISFVLVREQ